MPYWCGLLACYVGYNDLIETKNQTAVIEQQTRFIERQTAALEKQKKIS